VALAVGFADQSHFTRRFHRLIGCTPGAFARNYQTGRISTCVLSSPSRHVGTA
jgi:AraC family transcriptional regulator